MRGLTEASDSSATTPVPSPRRSCWIYGCLGFVLFSLAIVFCGGGFGYWYLSNQVEKFTASEPAPLPKVEYSPEKIKELEVEIHEFQKAVESEEVKADDLILSADDLNALISRDTRAKDKVHLRIEDGVVIADVSVPTDQIPGGKGRYLNANVRLQISLEEGALVVKVASAEVKGEPIPQTIIESLAGENLAKDLANDETASNWLGRFESLTIEENQIRLTPKAGPLESLN